MAIAEARFMRALAYRFLVMNWGPVPVIENNFDHLFDTSISRNTVTSVWRFITREMRAAAEDFPEHSCTGRKTYQMVSRRNVSPFLPDKGRC